MRYVLRWNRLTGDAIWLAFTGDGVPVEAAEACLGMPHELWTFTTDPALIEAALSEDFEDANEDGG